MAFNAILTAQGRYVGTEVGTSKTVAAQGEYLLVPTSTYLF